MKEDTIEILSNYVDQLIDYAMQKLRNYDNILCVDAVEKVFDSLSIEERKIIDDFILQCISSRYDFVGEIYKLGFNDCLQVLKSANKI